MKKITVTMIIGVALMILFTANSTVLGDSLWSDQSSSLYSAKQRNFEIGDLITVLIVEQASASQQAETKDGKDVQISVGPNTGLFQSIPSMGAGWNTDYNGKGATTRGGTLKATISVQVKDVLPGGVLVLEGRQVIRVNKEEQVIVITGNVRSEDVLTDNTVFSTRIANAVIEFEGTGTVGDSQKPGLLWRIFHWIF
jgi:flagellar L-ring protein precursor FlgH